MLHRKLNRRNKRLRWAALVALLLCAVGLGVYAIHAGSTKAWPRTQCTIDGTRVVRADVADSSSAIVMYQGEYRLKYVVSGHDYYVWANSRWSDVDRQFVQDKTDSSTGRCDFLVAYNPEHPSEAVVVPLP